MDKVIRQQNPPSVLNPSSRASPVPPSSLADFPRCCAYTVCIHVLVDSKLSHQLLEQGSILRSTSGKCRSKVELFTKLVYFRGVFFDS